VSSYIMCLRAGTYIQGFPFIVELCMKALSLQSLHALGHPMTAVALKTANV